jgi:NAD(P)-dependent dehydrogenase (short-subunit alcohol dehydrogenase family)
VPVSFELSGKRALVTGGSRGIGKAIAFALADAGADVAVTSRTGRDGDPVCNDIERRGRKSLSLLLEVRHLRSIDTCFDRLDAEWGGLEILVNNAGINVPRRIFEVEEDDWDTVLDTDLKGLFFVSQAAARRMVDGGKGGRIVNIASQYGLVANVNRVTYSAAKGGVVNLTRALALELAPHQITVNAVAPTFVPTELTQEWLSDERFMAEIKSNIPLGRLASPEDVAPAVVYLASPAAAMVTGHTLLVDGGWTAI